MRDADKKGPHLKRVLPQEKNAINLDIYDERTFREMLHGSKRMQNTNIRGREVAEIFKELHQDVFGALFKHFPKLREKNEMAYTHLLSREVMEIILDTKKYKELRGMTRSSAMESTIATESVSDDVIEILKDVKDKHEQMQKELKELEAEAKAASEDTKKEGDNAAKAKQALRYKQAQEQLEEFLKNKSKILSKEDTSKIRKSLEKAVTMVKDTSELITNWGLGESQEFTQSSHAEKMAMLDRIRNSDKLKQIAKMAGRLRRMAIETQREKIRRGNTELFDVTKGNNISRLLTSEALLLSNSDTEDLFYLKYTEKSLLEYEYQDISKKIKGPIIVCIDDSGSMNGNPEVFSKAVALALLEICKIQKRSMHVIHFDASRKENLKVHSFPRKTPPNMSEVISMAEYFLGGGTLFEPALELSQDKINETGEFSKADIIFITDGEAAIRDNWLKDYLAWKKAAKVNIVSILINCSDNSDSCIKTFSDQIEKFSDINDSNERIALNIFNQV